MARYGELTLRSPELLITAMGDRHTNRSLATKAGCSYAMIGHLRTGRSKSCRRCLAVRIAQALDVRLDLLFVTDPEPAPAAAPGR